MKRRRFALIVALALVPVFPARADEPEEEAPESIAPAADCAFVPSHHDGRSRWGQLTRDAEALAPSASHAPVTLEPQGDAPKRHLKSFVDQEIFAKMDADHVRPAPRSTDEEFLRRVTLDLTGQIPDVVALRAFLLDPKGDKRARKVDELLASAAYADRFTMWLGDLVENVQRSTFSNEYYPGRNAYYSFLKESLRSGKGYDLMVRELITGSGDSFAHGAANYWIRQIQPNGPIQDTYDNLSAHTTEKFLALQTNCTSCHDGAGHVDAVNLFLSTKKRTEFWKNAAFFARSAAKSMNDPVIQGVKKYDVTDNTTGAYKLNTRSGNKTARQPAAGQPDSVDPAFYLTGEAPRGGEPWRTAYARILTSHPQFTRAAVNFVWKEMFGLGLVEPADSFDLLRLDPNNPPPSPWTIQPSHPALLEKLADSFRKSGYDFRALLRTIANSETYQLSARYTSGPWSEAWVPYFARRYPKRLSAEQLLDAVVKATGVKPTDAQFTVQGLGVVPTSMALPDTTELGNSYGAFLNTFGRGNRDDAARTNDGSIVQALALLNDRTITDRVKATTAGSTVQRTLAATKQPEAIVDTLYATTLTRRPTASEKTAAVAYLKSGDLTKKTEDLQFALLNRLEFLYD